MPRKRSPLLIALSVILSGPIASGIAGAAPSARARLVADVAQSTAGRFPPREPRPNAGAGDGWLIPGLTAAGLAGWILSRHHAPQRGQPRRQSASSPAPVVLTGTVKDEAGQPVPSAAVELLSPNAISLRAERELSRRVRTVAQDDMPAYLPQAYVETDVNGRYSILSKLRAGAHVLVASALDYALTQATVDIETGAQHVVHDVVLHEPSTGATPAPYEQRAIFYATDRAPDDRGARFKYANVARTAPGVAVGRATISVARSDSSNARFAPGTYTAVQRLAYGQAVVDDIARPMASDTFTTTLVAQAQHARSRSILIYIHGYNQGFDDGVRDAAQFQYETGLDAAIVAYSWPSAHDLLKYAADEDSNSASATNFVQFLGPLKAAAAGVGVRIIIVAHSMGNRIAVRGFEMLPGCADAAVMAAPDVYSKEITNGLTLVRKGVGHLTIYASRTDQALLLSNVFHQDYRVGLFAQHPFIATGVDTIDATAVDTSMLGHSYFIESTTVAGDIAGFFAGAAPAQRPNLREDSVETFKYWTIVPPH